MDNIYNDTNYMKIINNIITNNDFLKLSDISHHGFDRLSHSIKVSYIAYKIAKLIKLDYKETACAGLLHDFFYTNTKENKKIKWKSLFLHNKIALKNANNLFSLTDKGQDIIKSHMFPINITKVPKYLESWIVNLVDKGVAITEFSIKYNNICNIKMNNALVLLMLFLGRIL